MIGAIKKLFAGLFAFLGGIFNLGKKGNTASKAKKGSKEFFLELDEARGYKEPSVAANPKPAKVSAAASTATEDKPAPAVKTPASAQPAPTFTYFGSRRRPGANMQSFLAMARTIKPVGS